MTVTRLIARPMLASMFVVGGVNALKNADAHAAKAKPVTDRLVPLLQKAAPQVQIPEDTATLVRINAVAQIARRRRARHRPAPRGSPRRARRLAGADHAGRPPVLGRDRPAGEGQPADPLFKNLSMLGGLLLAAVDTEGKPGVAWRARRAATDVRREAKHLAAAATPRGQAGARPSWPDLDSVRG